MPPCWNHQQCTPCDRNSAAYSSHLYFIALSLNVVSLYYAQRYPVIFRPICTSFFIFKNMHNELDSLRWFSQRRSPTPHFGGAHPGGYDPKFELGRDFVQCTYLPGFIIVCLLVRKLSCRQTNKEAPLKTSNALRYATTLCNNFEQWTLLQRWQRQTLCICVCNHFTPLHFCVT